MQLSALLKRIEFEAFKNEAGSNAFTMTPTKWIKGTNAIGIVTKRGRYASGTYAYKDIAFEFASWISPEFKLYIIKDYQRLKQDESSRLSFEWNEKRLFSKLNYRIHTDAIKKHIADLKQNNPYVYSTEADMLNVVVFGMTAKQWRESNANSSGNIRDYASAIELLVLANIESMNAELIKQGKERNERFSILIDMAQAQLEVLSESNNKIAPDSGSETDHALNIK